MLPQPYTAAQLAADEAEGAAIIAKFSADLDAHHKAKYGTQKSAIQLLTALPLIKAQGNRFHNQVEAYSQRGDLQAHYSSRQLVALAAAVILHPLLDMPPNKFHGIFVYCCSIAETQTPPKLNTGKNRITFKGIPLSKFL